VPQITTQLETILQQENIEYEDAAVRQLAFSANGSMRDALSLLDQAIAFGNGSVHEAEVRSMLGTIDRDVVYRLLTALSQADAALLMEEVAKADSFAPDYAMLLADIVSVLQRVAVAQTLPDVVDDSQGDRDAVLSLAAALSAEDVQLYYQIALLGRRDLPLSPEPRGGFEMVMLRMLAFRPAAAEQTGVPAASTFATAMKQTPATPVKQANKKAAAPLSSEDSDWSAIIASLSLKGMAREMSLNCAFHGIEGDVVNLSLDPAHGHLLGKTRVEQLEQALSGHYQRTVSVRIDAGKQLETETPAARKTREIQERQRKAEQSIDEDENIRALQDAFGGSVAQDSIRPRD
jgi:DNA polymerase-3 subunit gamma/tau